MKDLNPISPYDPSGGFSVGAGALAILKAHALVASTNEQYAHGQNGFITSLTYATDESRILAVSDDNGASWDVHRIINAD